LEAKKLSEHRLDGVGVTTNSRLVLNRTEPVAVALVDATVIVVVAIDSQHFQTRENNNRTAIRRIHARAAAVLHISEEVDHAKPIDKRIEL
jgi:hypothetical protein